MNEIVKSPDAAGEQFDAQAAMRAEANATEAARQPQEAEGAIPASGAKAETDLFPKKLPEHKQIIDRELKGWINGTYTRL